MELAWCAEFVRAPGWAGGLGHPVSVQVGPWETDFLDGGRWTQGVRALVQVGLH